ncbi:MAG: M50 family metallopeptidase [Terracidiphilus sp.]
MAIIKRVLSFFYSIQAVFFAALVFFLYAPNPRMTQLHAHRSPGVIALAAVISAALVFLFAAAWYTVRRGMASARYWVILPSLFYLGVAGGSLLPRVHANFLMTLLFLGIGVAGPLVTWRKRSRAVSTGTAPIPKIKGDGTSDLLNHAGAFFSIVSYLGSLMLWNQWLRSQGLPVAHRGLLQVIAISLVATFFHELGHVSIGVAFKMKLRAFVVGPLLWRIDEGRWKFKFNPAGFLSLGGATGVVPTSATQPAWQQLTMIAAGPATNFYLGILSGALAIAFTNQPESYAMYISPLALFAIINFVDCFTNLIPLRTATGYSDGAQIYQILSNGPWAAYHRAMSVVSSSMVTPLRPRDYDMEALAQASQGISEGMVGLLLRLFKYSHFMDCGRLQEAGQAIKEAEAIYDKPGTKLPAPLHTVFVFANAYVLRDASAARAWWQRMTALKPTRFNVDYWLASSALQWIEGNLAQANEDWAKCNDKALKLPAAGAYEFDRYLCSLLHRVMVGDMTPPERVEPMRVQKPAPAGTLNEVALQAPPVGTSSVQEHQWLYLQAQTKEMRAQSREN